MKRSIYFAISIFLVIVSCNKSGSNNDTQQASTASCNATEYTNAPSQSFFTSFSGTGEEAHGHHILTCSDGGYLQVGETGTFPTSAKILVVKTDSSGTLTWKKEFGTAGHNLGNSAYETTDGYLIAGSMDRNSVIIKLNKEDGTEIFSQTHDNGQTDAFEHLALLSQDTIVAVGYINANDDANAFYTEGQGYVTFLDSQGGKIHEFSINQYLSHAYRIKNYNNQLIISGLTHEANNYGLMKLDNTGQIIWSKKFGGTNADHCFGMDVSTTDGSIFLTGHTLSGTQNWDTYTMKIDNDGDLVWETKQGNTRGFDPTYIHDEAWDIKATSDGGCIVVAGTGDEYSNYSATCSNGDNSDIWEVYVIKLDSNGGVVWQQTYASGNGQDWAGEAIDLTSDGGAIIGVDNSQFAFMKIEPF